jgi:hypothetical protein
MTDYTKSTNFASKDSLSPGSALKIVRGTEIDTEFNNIATAVATKANSSDVTSSLATKADLASPALTGNPTAPTPTAGDNDTSIATTAFVTTAVAALGYPAFKNRIINGAMVIDQRNAGASVTGSGYSVDRFYNAFTSTNATQQRSTTVPQGFTNSLLVTVTTATAPGTSSLAYISQTIEGFNVADMDFGKATAVTFTLSFWVRSSLTGTYAVGFLNSAQNRSYVATYTINAANTWEQKTITVTGDTSGTWLTDNGKGLSIFWDLGSGSNYQATAGSWQAGLFLRTSGSNNFANTLSATFYITGVQLEKGSTATSFDYRPYGTELALCQRYYAKLGLVNLSGLGSGVAISSTDAWVYVKHPVSMRTSPTFTQNSLSVYNGNNLYSVTGIVTTYAGNDATTLRIGASTLTATQGIVLACNTTAGYLDLASEL